MTAPKKFRRFETSPNFYQSRQWLYARKEAKRRAGGACQGTGCGEYDELDVHHLVSRQARPDLALDPGNLVVLCRRCHQAYHHWIHGYSPFSSAQPANDAQFELPFGEAG